MRCRQAKPLALFAAVLTLAGCGRATTTAALITRPGATTPRPAAAAPPPPHAAEAPPSVSVLRAPQAPERPPQAGDEVIVKFRDRARDLPGATRLRSLTLSGTAVYKLNAGGYALQAAEDWETEEDIDYIEPNYVYSAVAAPNDPDYLAGWGVEAINAPVIWPFTTGEGIKVAVIDTGVDASHPDLAGRVLPGVDVVNNDGDATDAPGHGTHVAGTIAAIANNALGTAGVAPGAQVLPIKVLNAAGRGTNADIAAGILAAADRGAQIINLSLGGTDDSETLRRAIASVQARGVVVIAAAGNEGVSTPFFPAANEGVIGVAAVDSSRKKARFSNFGDYIDVAAPGVSIGSTRRGGGIATLSGTSMAAPHVAAACALLKARFPALKAGHLTRLMQLSGHPTTGFTRGVVPRALNVEEAFVQVPNLDMQPPTVVTGLSAAAGAPGEVELAWAPATDNSGSVSYRVLRDGQPVGTTGGTAYTDRGVTARATYRIVTLDAQGNEAAPSHPVASEPGKASTKIMAVTVSKRSRDSVTLTWRTTEPMRCLVQWGTSASLGNGTAWETVPSTAHTVTLSNLKRFTTYHHRVVAATNDSTLHYTNTRKTRTKLFWLFSLPG
ncbi:MAG: S8 family serine peptidase [Candidatus Sericytochromatia bacterium]|nr:S8 family serine peptidase [Candidatus Sericytochromatia bacterium]